MVNGSSPPQVRASALENYYACVEAKADPTPGRFYSSKNRAQNTQFVEDNEKVNREANGLVDITQSGITSTNPV